MYGNGPLSPTPAGRFNFETPEPGMAVYLEPTPKRIRVQVGGETIADSRRAFMLHEAGLQPIYYFPPEDVRSEFLEPHDKHTYCPKKGDASYYTIRVGDTVVDAGAWYYPEPLAGAPPIENLIAFYWGKMDRWLEEDEEAVVHPRDPYHRIDVLRTERHIRISLDGELLAQTSGAMALFESNLPTRWYLRREDISAELEPSDTITHCPYKGEARYHSVKLGSGELAEDLVWYYADPLPEVGKIAGLVCFFNEKVDIQLDGEPQERPDTPWSRKVKSEAGNASPAQSRA
jgi:uncharacterized protein (DUF427 family)